MPRSAVSLRVQVQGVEWIFSPVPDARGRGVHQLCGWRVSKGLGASFRVIVFDTKPARPLRDKRPRKLVPLGRSVLNAEEAGQRPHSSRVPES